MKNNIYGRQLALIALAERKGGRDRLPHTGVGTIRQPLGARLSLPLDPLISQNHRMFGVERDLCGSSSPTPLPKQGHLQQAAQDLVQAGLEYLQRRRLHNLLGQPVPGLRHPQREEVLPQTSGSESAQEGRSTELVTPG